MFVSLNYCTLHDLTEQILSHYFVRAIPYLFCYNADVTGLHLLQVRGETTTATDGCSIYDALSNTKRNYSLMFPEGHFHRSKTEMSSEKLRGVGFLVLALPELHPTGVFNVAVATPPPWACM